MNRKYGAVGRLILFVAISVLLPSSFAQSMGVNGGLLSWTTTTRGLSEPGGAYCPGTMYSFSNFTYSYTVTSPQGTTIPITVSLGGGASYISGSSGPPYCPPNGPEPGTAILTDGTEFYRIAFSATSGSGGTAAMESFNNGAVYPKYVVLSVIYAPPGAGNSSGNQSYVNYQTTTELGTDTTFSGSFQDSNTMTFTGSLFDVKESLSSSYTQEVDTSSSTSINQTSTNSNQYPGDYPANIVGLDHDNDIILVWLNAALDCAAEPAWSYSPNSFPAAVQCVEYDPLGAPGDPDSQYGIPDIAQIAVGNLNGDFSMQTQQPGLYTLLQQHGLTSTDLANILAQDPYGQCAANTACMTQIGVPEAHFYSTGQAVDFENYGITSQQQLTYQETNQTGQGGSSTYTLGFTLSGSTSFQNIFSASLTNQQSLMWTNKWSELTTSMTGQQATAHITEPGTNIPYSGPNAAIQFGVFQDNVYGTFMFYPTEW